MTRVSSCTGNRNRLGKDHFMLADWRISVAKFQQRRKPDGTNVDHAEYVIERQHGTCQRVTLESPSRVGLPAAGDEDFIIALLFLAKQQGFASDLVRFVPTQLLSIMGLAWTKKNYDRLKAALKRLRAVTITYESTWYSRAKQAVEPILITGILAEAKLVFRRGRRAKDETPDSYVQWTRHFYTSLQEGNLTNLDLDVYFGWQRPGSKHLHRHLNKVWHAGRKPKVYERDLKELACGHLGMTDCKDLKRNFQQIVKEMEKERYLLPVDESVRYQKIRSGVWRVRLEMHPERSAKKQGVGESPKHCNSAASDAETLVCLYHKHRFGRQAYTPKAHELKHARTILACHSVKSLVRLIPTVADAASKSYRGQDCHFGAAVPFFQSALEQQAKRTEQRSTPAQPDTRISDERRDLTQMRSQRLSVWNSLTTEQKTACYERAVAAASSELIRTKLRRSRNLQNPPTEVLAVMAEQHHIRGGES